MTQERNTQHDLYEEIIIAGFGGQGIIFTGKLLAQTAMEAGKHTTYIPAYGAEVRGGTSNCSVIIAEKEIASPLISNPKSLIAMNKASNDHISGWYMTITETKETSMESKL